MMNHFSKRILVVITLTLLLHSLAFAAGESDEDESSRDNIRVERWLLLGPLPVPLPAFDKEGKSSTKPADLLVYDHFSKKNLVPIKNEKVRLIGADIKWDQISANDSGIALPAAERGPQIAYLVTYVNVPRWMKIDVEVKSTHPFELKIDGESVITQKKGAKLNDDDAKKSGTTKLEKGTHVLVVKTVYVPADTAAEWRLDVNVGPGKDFDETPELSLTRARTMRIGDILDGPAMGRVDMSPDGRFFVLSMSKRTPPEGDRESWLEIRTFKDGKLVKTLRDISGASDWQWAPTGNRLSYVKSKDDAGTVRVMDLDSGEVEDIVENIKDLSGYGWSPDGTYITYSVNKEAEKDETGVKRHMGIYDRRSGERDKTTLHVASVPSGTDRRLTAGEHSSYLYDIHPDGRSILVGRSYEDLSDRPYSSEELVQIDVEAQQADTLWKGRWFGSAGYSPDGKSILVTASPNTFGSIGHDVPDGVIPNDYDTQAYIFDPATKSVDPITRDFDPSVRSVFWPKPGGDIYLVVGEGEYVKLYRYNIKKRKFTEIELGFDVIHRLDVARDKPLAIATGSSADHPWRLYSIDLKSGKVSTLLNPSSEQFGDVTLGKVEAWSFETSEGKEIVGRVHYPPDFDSDKSWPCIVYYYGGTSPVSRSFGGRYPKNLWAANGYVVYVLQPSGATGFGQEWSALHVNEWGRIVSDEIIQGTESFLDAHAFVDPNRVGCIGASFGGFMTQLLVTKTNMFAAAVSHAGISSISSYWGEGYWGYGYNSVSAANSFPWNRPDIYVDQSPLFSADDIDTPLLLLHGAVDTNVPPGESEQMYTALKLLGKEVEYISIAGQNHWIVDYKKRIIWSNTIVSWFDRLLKGEPQWWNDMYPPLDEEAAAASE